jgi:hypothetical protein
MAQKLLEKLHHDKSTFLKFWLWPLVDDWQSTYLPHTIAQNLKTAVLVVNVFRAIHID